MKKYSWIMALLLALTLAFIGCPTDGGGGPTGGGEGPPPFTSDLVAARGTGGSWAVTLSQTQYSDGAQVQMDYPQLMQGNKVTEDDEYTLELAFTIDRVPTTNILIYLVDNTEASEGYWRKLTNTVEIDKDELEVGTPYEVTFELTASGTASSAAADANKLCIETTEKLASGTNSADLIMTFTTFLFSRGGGAEPPAVYVPTPVVDEEDYTVNLEGLVMKNAEAWDANYQNLWLDLSQAFPADFDINNYDAYTLKAKFYDADGEEITLANGLGQSRFALGNAYSGGEWLTSENKGNLGMDENVGLYDNELLVNPTMLYVQNTNASVAFIEITEITFHWGSDRLVSVSAPEPLPVAPIVGFTLVPSLTLDASNFNDTNWSWKASDQGEGYIKGRISPATATAIKAVAGGKYQIYWVSSNGQPINNGIGSFGGQAYNAGSGGPANGSDTETRGIVVGDILPLTLETGGNAGQLNLNTYNAGGVVKILFYSSDAPVADVAVTERAISGITAPASGQAPVTTVTATNQFTGTVAWAAGGTSLTGNFADGAVYTATITLTATTGYTFNGVGATAGFTVAGATTVTNTAGSGKTIVVTAVFPATTAPATALTVTVNGAEKQTTSLTGHKGTVTLLNDGSGVTFKTDSGTDTEYDWSYFVFKLDLGAALNSFGEITFNVTGTTYKEVWVRAGNVDITGHKGSTAEAVLFEKSGTNTLAGSPALVLAIDLVEAAKANGTDLFFAIDVRMGASDGPITVTNIKFNPKGADVAVDIAAIPLNHPIAGGTPTATVDTTQYTGAVTWSPAIEAGDSFAPSQIYTATIILAAKPGFTLEDEAITENFFTLAGATSIDYDPDTKTVTVVFPETEATALAALPITFEASDVDSTLKAVGGTVVVIDTAGTGGDENGYTFTRTTGGYGSGFASFKVPLPTGGKLSDYTSVTFTYQGISGDIGSKSLVLLAWDDSFTATSIGGNPPANGVTAVNVTNIGTANINVNGTAVMASQSFTLHTAANTFDDSAEVWLSFYTHAGNNSGNEAVIQISNIVLHP